MSSSLCTQQYLCFKSDLSSRFAFLLSPLVPTSSQISSKRLHYLEKFTSPLLVMSSTCIRLLSIFSSPEVLRIIKKWLSIVSEHHKRHTLHLYHDLVYQRLYQEQFDMILIENTSYSRQWNTYTALRIHLFDTTLFHLLSSIFLQHTSQYCIEMSCSCSGILQI